MKITRRGVICPHILHHAILHVHAMTHVEQFEGEVVLA